MKKIYYLICVLAVATLASCSSTDSLTEQEKPAPNVLELELNMTKDAECEDHN